MHGFPLKEEQWGRVLKWGAREDQKATPCINTLTLWNRERGTRTSIPIRLRKSGQRVLWASRLVSVLRDLQCPDLLDIKDLYSVSVYESITLTFWIDWPTFGVYPLNFIYVPSYTETEDLSGFFFNIRVAGSLNAASLKKEDHPHEKCHFF
jgi:hypothetical protein